MIETGRAGLPTALHFAWLDMRLIYKDSSRLLNELKLRNELKVEAAVVTVV